MSRLVDYHYFLLREGELIINTFYPFVSVILMYFVCFSLVVWALLENLSDKCCLVAMEISRNLPIQYRVL